MKIPDEKRPICTCGKPLQLVMFSGYYSTMYFWQCSYCKIDDYEPDYIETDSEY